MRWHREGPRARSGVPAILGFLLIAFAVSTGPARAEDPVPQTVDAAHTLAGEGVAAAKAKDIATAERKMRLVLASPAFAKLDPKDQHDTWSILGWADLQNDKPDEAIAMFRLACGSKFGTVFDWIKRAQIARSLHYDVESVDSMTLLVQRAPASLSPIRSFFMYQTADEAAAISDASVIAFLGPLHAMHWHAEDRYEGDDSMWLLLARAYLDKGDVKEAADAMSDVSSLRALIEARSEKLFDPVVAMDRDKYDIAKAATRNLAKYQQWMKEDPDKLQAVQMAADALIAINRPNDALALTDAALARIKAAGNGPPAFSDMTELNWLSNTRSNALWASGRIDDALAAMAAAARETEDGRSNVSQRMNLAGNYDAAGKPHEALDAVADLSADSASPYGRMVLAKVRACAYAQLNDAENLRQQINYIRAHIDDAPGGALDAFICSGDLDDAAATMIEQVQDPKTRSRALLNMQNYADSRTPIELADHMRFVTVEDRPDVRKVVDAIGHIDTYPILGEGID
ncbi:MAG: hypothetical protein ACTHLR_14500 [Rhizomicrobium sp.]